MNFRSRYSDRVPGEFAFTCAGETMTQAQFAAECDVNNILAKYRKTGMLSHVNRHEGNFGDFTDVGDYQSSLDRLMRAQSSFNSLPSELRSKFHNDPANLVAYLADDANVEESYKLGLRVRKAEPESLSVSLEKALEANDKKREERVKNKKD